RSMNSVHSGASPSDGEGRHADSAGEKRAAQTNLFGDDPDLAPPMPWEQAAEQDRFAAQVVLNKPLAAAYTYLVPDELRDLVGPGQRVRVPFGRGDRSETGYVVAVGPSEATSR